MLSAPWLRRVRNTRACRLDRWKVRVRPRGEATDGELRWLPASFDRRLLSADGASDDASPSPEALRTAPREYKGSLYNYYSIGACSRACVFVCVCVRARS